MKNFVLCTLFLFPLFTFAHQPILVEPVSSDDRIVVEQPELERTYFGELDGYPHTYEVNALEPFTLSAQILLPAVKSEEGFRSVIVVQKVERGVEDVVRFQYNPNAAESDYDASTGDTYNEGTVLQQELEAGTYYIEVSTSVNEGKYVLRIGEGDALYTTGYFAKLKEVLVVKHFFGKPLFAVLQSPYYYIPTLVLLLLGLLVYRKHKRKYVS